MLDFGGDMCHVDGVAKEATSSALKAGGLTAKVGAVYRGVRLQATNEPSRFTRDQILKAVESAIEKNADALSGRTKV